LGQQERIAIVFYTYKKPAPVIRSAGTLFPFHGQAISFQSEENWLMKTLKLTGILLVLIFAITTVVPVSGPVAVLSPISTAWAAPNCDVDGDGFITDSGYCRNRYPGPYDCDDSTSSATNDCSGSGTGGDLGSAIQMECMLEGAWGDSSGETIKGDLLDDDSEIGSTKYSDAVDKVDCSIDGPSLPWPIRLGMGVKGKPENSVRKVDVDLDSFAPPLGFGGVAGVDTGRLGSSLDLSGTVDDPVYPTLFEPAGDGSNGPNMDEMDPIRINVRPYREEPNYQTEDGIHLLPWSATPYRMGMRFSIPGTERFSFSIAAQWYEGNESFTGIGCETGFEQQILDNAPGGGMQDVSVYLWRDGDDDADDLPDGYTVTTGTIGPVVKVDGIYPEGPPPVASDTKYAAVCSSVGPDVCGNPRAPSNCNFLGYAPVQFTLHTRVK